MPEQKWLCHAISDFPMMIVVDILPDGDVCEVIRISPNDRFQTTFTVNSRSLLDDVIHTLVYDAYHEVLVIDDKF